MLRFDANRELSEGEILELNGDVLLTECELSALWGGSVVGDDARIFCERAGISGNIDEHAGGSLRFRHVHFSGSAPEGEALISVGAGAGRFSRCTFENVTGTVLSADLLGRYPPPADDDASDSPADDNTAFLGALLRPGGIHEGIHVALDACEFRNCRASGELAAPLQILTADTMHTAGLVLFRDCTFDTCAGTAGLVYLQDLADARDLLPERWPLRVAFVNCRFVNCARLEGPPGNSPRTPRIVLEHCEFTGCQPADLFQENVDEIEEAMAEVLRGIPA